MREIGLNTMSWRYSDKHWKYVAGFAQEEHISQIEVGVTDGICYFNGLMVCPHVGLIEDPQGVRAEIQSKGARVSQVNATFALTSPEGVIHGLGYVTRAIQFAVALDADGVVVSDEPDRYLGRTQEPDLGVLLHQLMLICEAAAPYGMIINLEPKSSLTTSVEGIERILDAVGSSQLGLSFNPAWIRQQGGEPSAYLEAMVSQVNYVRCHDTAAPLTAPPRGLRDAVPLGAGTYSADIEACLALLRRKDWAGVVCLDLLGEPAIVESLDWLKQRV